MRYYLITPQPTFVKIKHKVEVEKTRDVEVPTYDENGDPILDGEGNPVTETVQENYWDEEDNPDYDIESDKLLGKFNRVHSRNWETIEPKTLDGNFSIIETDLIGTEIYTEQDLIDDGETQEDIDKLKVDGELDNTLLERYHLDKQVKHGDITDYGHWPHSDDEDRPCIHCYLEAHKIEWQIEEA